MLGCTGYTDCPQCKRLDAQCSLRAKAIVTTDPVEDALKVGDTFNFTVGLRDDSMSLPVQDVLTIRVVDEEKAHKKAKQKGQPVHPVDQRRSPRRRSGNSALASGFHRT